MSTPMKKLFDIEIDEVSVVDRPANQHGLIAFAKSAEGIDDTEGVMPEDLFDAEGSEVPVEVLEHGDVVFDAEGNEYVYVEEDDDDDDVEKGWQDVLGKLGSKFSAGREAAKKKAMPYVDQAKTSDAGQEVIRRKNAAMDYAKKNPGKTFAAGAGIGAGTGYAFGKAEMSDHMSLGDSVLEELSKAVTDYDREEIIAKAMDEVEIAKAQAAEAFEYAAAMEDARIEEAFISKAAEYNLPVAPEVFGPILKSIAETLTDEELEVIDELFSAIGDALYNEIGYVGESDNASVLDAVDGLAHEFVGKSDVSYEQAFTAMFESNPSAYDAYLQEGR